VAYAYRYRDAYPDGIFWLNAVNEWRVEFSRLVDDLDLPVSGRSATLDISGSQGLSTVLAAIMSLRRPTLRLASALTG
jgi:hypothetical protein